MSRLNVELKIEEGKKVLKKYEKGDINKSDCIRSLIDCGYSVSEISSSMKIIYNMVYNISKKYIIKNDLEDNFVSDVKIKIEDEIKEEYNKILEKEGKVKKSDLIKVFIKKGRGEGYIYSKLKYMELDFK